jgi:hypothetical protein
MDYYFGKIKISLVKIKKPKFYLKDLDRPSWFIHILNWSEATSYSSGYDL